MYTQLKTELRQLSIPDRVKRLPRDHRGFPIPWFVYTEAGKPDFRVIGPGKVERAVRLNLCWICGTTLARHKTWCLGPMCAVNRTTSEPPMHRSCAMFSAQACPFLMQPRMRRNEKDLPEERVIAGNPVMDNPGLVCVWIARDFQLMPVDTGMLFHVGEPEEVRWIARGRPASRQEVLLVLKQRLPILIDVAHDEGPDAMQALFQQIVRVRQYLPPIENEVPYALDHRAPQIAARRESEQAGGRDQEKAGDLSQSYDSAASLLT